MGKAQNTLPRTLDRLMKYIERFNYSPQISLHFLSAISSRNYEHYDNSIRLCELFTQKRLTNGVKTNRIVYAIKIEEALQ